MTTDTTARRPSSEPALSGGLSRRSFLKWSAAAGGAAAMVAGGTHFGVMPGVGWASDSAGGDAADDVLELWSTCNVNCGGRCPLRVHVRDGQVVRVLPDNTGDDEIGSQQVRACVRGRSIRQRVYSPDRLKKPMRRVGERGSGEWEEISWDEAFDEIADNIKRILDEYGNEAILNHYGSGQQGTVNRGGRGFTRLMSFLGGHLAYYNNYSNAQITHAMEHHYGANVGANSYDDAKNAKLQVWFGDNPMETNMSGGGSSFVAQRTRKNSDVRTIIIDPRYTDTAMSLADEWVPTRIGADAALVAGMAHVMISEDLHDQEFLDTYCQGFDEDHMPDGIPPGNSYKSYVMGEGPDGVAKTPEWAAEVTGVPAGTIKRLAREIGSTRPVIISQGWGSQRQAHGETQAKAIFTLAAMTGCIGIPGGSTGQSAGTYGIGVNNVFDLPNPVETAIPVFLWTDAIERATEMTALNSGIRGKERLDVPVKMIWNSSGNTLVNQHSDINRTTELLKDDSKCEFIAVVETHMSVSARYADILLPDASNLEQIDVIPANRGGTMGAIYLPEKIIDPLYDCKTVYEMCTELAKRLGVEEEFTEGKSQEDWVRDVVEATQDEVPGLPGFDELREMGIWREPDPPEVGFIPLQEFREDPEANPLETPSGRIEIFSSTLWELGETWELPEGDRIPAIGEQVATWEGPEEAVTNSKYPLQCIGHHHKQRAHSTYGNIPWMLEAHPQLAWISPIDAEERGIANDDMIEVFNDRGRTRLPARVTARIAPGLVSVPQGAWFDPDDDGVDTGGSQNILTNWRPSPIAKANPQHTNLVQVKRA